MRSRAKILAELREAPNRSVLGDVRIAILLSLIGELLLDLRDHRLGMPVHWDEADVPSRNAKET